MQLSSSCLGLSETVTAVIHLWAWSTWTMWFENPLPFICRTFVSVKIGLNDLQKLSNCNCFPPILQMQFLVELFYRFLSLCIVDISCYIEGGDFLLITFWIRKTQTQLWKVVFFCKIKIDKRNLVRIDRCFLKKKNFIKKWSIFSPSFQRAKPRYYIDFFFFT